MNTKLLVTVSLLTCLLSTGCASTYYRQRESNALKERTELQNLKDDVAKLKQRIEGIEVRLDEKDTQSAGARSAAEKDIKELKEAVAALDREVKSGASAHEDLKREIVADLSKRIADKLPQIVGAPSQPVPRHAGKTTVEGQGKEHVVQQGETLTAIAATHKVSVSALIQANNLKSANSIRVGQKLAIPTQE